MTQNCCCVVLADTGGRNHHKSGTKNRGMSKEEKKAHKRAREKSGDHVIRFCLMRVLSTAFVVTAAAKASEAAAAKKPKIIIIKKTPKHQPPKKKKPANPVYKFSLNKTEVSAMEAAGEFVANGDTTSAQAVMAQVCANSSYETLKRSCRWLSDRQYRTSRKVAVLQKHGMQVARSNNKKNPRHRVSDDDIEYLIKCVFRKIRCV